MGKPGAKQDKYRQAWIQKTDKTNTERPFTNGNTLLFKTLHVMSKPTGCLQDVID